MSTGIPSTIDLLVVGGGSAGAALAGIVARDSDLNVLLLEAGPDYGPYDAGGWPDDLLDALKFPETHDWGYSGLNRPSHRVRTPYDRARVIGGCSSHNGCVEVIGHRRDYDPLGGAWQSRLELGRCRARLGAVETGDSGADTGRRRADPLPRRLHGRRCRRRYPPRPRSGRP